MQYDNKQGTNTSPNKVTFNANPVNTILTTLIPVTSNPRRLCGTLNKLTANPKKDVD